MRVFLAVDLDKDVRKRLADLTRELRPLARNARWVPVENLHLTLRFFGEAASGAVKELSASLSDALRDIPGFEFDLRGSGVFPDRKRPRVLWVGIPEPAEALLALQARAESVARAAGFEAETRRFEPHLTIARFRGPESRIDSILEAGRDRDFGRTSVTEALLFESRLSNAGASYHVLSSYALPPSSTSSGISAKRLV